MTLLVYASFMSLVSKFPLERLGFFRWLKRGLPGLIRIDNFKTKASGKSLGLLKKRLKAFSTFQTACSLVYSSYAAPPHPTHLTCSEFCGVTSAKGRNPKICLNEKVVYLDKNAHIFISAFFFS